jgi:hypothetical protein
VHNRQCVAVDTDHGLHQRGSPFSGGRNVRIYNRVLEDKILLQGKSRAVLRILSCRHARVTFWATTSRVRASRQTSST